jgi:hypothetical protein
MTKWHPLKVATCYAAEVHASKSVGGGGKIDACFPSPLMFSVIHEGTIKKNHRNTFMDDLVAKQLFTHDIIRGLFVVDG